jgi:hypothetical protein
MNPKDCLPVLIKCGDIIFEYLKKHLTVKQISTFLNYLNRPGITHGQVFRYITQKHGQPESIFNAIVSLARISNLCDAADFPSQEPLHPNGAFHVAFSALMAGMHIGMIADDEEKKALNTIVKHGKKFALSVGKHDDLFTLYLNYIFDEFHKSNGRYPQNKEVVTILESKQHNGFIHTVEKDGTVEWGKEGSTGLKALEKRLTKIRKNKKDSINKST